LRGLYTHVRRAHGISCDEYRARHGLRLRHPLATQDIRQEHADRARARMAADPQQWRTDFGHPPQVRAEFAARGRDSSAATAARPARRATSRARGHHAGAVKSHEARARLDHRARDLGYPDLYAYLDAHRDASGQMLADAFGITSAAANGWRRRLLGEVPDNATATRRARRRGLDEKARAAGYTDFAKLIDTTRSEPVKTLARRTTVSANTIKAHRKTRGSR
jgi:hypothetical protein